MKRYAIVRADKFCPRALERNYNLKCIGSLHCDKCDLRKKYGDTKEQMVKKVATAIFRSEVKSYKKYYGINPMRIITRDAETKCLKIAKEIVEFLGVE